MNIYRNDENGLELFDALALYAIVTGLYNMSLNTNSKEKQIGDRERIDRIEKKLDTILIELGGAK